MTRHPYSSAWPDMAPEDFSALVESIRSTGLRHPIVTFEGAVLDGWHRFRACKDAGVDPHFQEFEGEADRAAEFVEAEHTRRSITPGQRVAAILAMNAYRVGPGRPNNSLPGRELTTAQVAERAGASVSTVERVQRVASQAPEKLDRIKRGESVKAVEAELRAPTESKRDRPAPTVCPRCQELKHELEQVRDGAQEAIDQAEAAAILLATDPGKEVLQLKGYVRTLEGRRDHLMSENAQLKREVGVLRRRLGE